jgi:hypothetical protein
VAGDPEDDDFEDDDPSEDDKEEKIDDGEGEEVFPIDDPDRDA